MLLHVLVVWLYHRYKHLQFTTPLWRGLLCPRKPKATRRNSCSETAPAYSDALSPVHVLPAPENSAKFRTFSRAQSEQSFREISNPNLAACEEVTSTAPPVENVQNLGILSRDNAPHNVQQVPWPKYEWVSWRYVFFFEPLVMEPEHILWQADCHHNPFETFYHWNHFQIIVV